jgi:cytochrome P450
LTPLRPATLKEPEVQKIDDLTLYRLPVDDHAFWADPFPEIDAARRQHPWLARTDYGHFVHGYQAIKDIISLDERLRPNFDELVKFYGVEGTPWAKFQVEQLIGHTGEKHRRIRNSVGDAFTPRNVNRHLGLIRRNAASLLDEWVPKGSFDFTEFAACYPISVLCGLLGTTTDDIPRIRHALETQTRLTSRDPAIVPDLLAGYHVLWEYCDNLITEREKQGTGHGGLLDQLIAAKTCGQLDETELRYLLMILFPAGYDTSKNMLGLIMYQMLAHPAYWTRCAEDLGYCAKVTEEMFRHTSTAIMSRTVTQSFEYDGVLFPEDTRLLFGNSIAGRDPAAFEDANTFNPERVHKNRHVAFGRGAHICLGQHMAKIQITEGIHLMAQRIRNPRSAGKVAWRNFLGIWGLETLPIEFDPADAPAAPAVSH